MPELGIDWDAFLRERVAVKNADGGRNYEGGNRTFDCPWCCDGKGRGWFHVLGAAAGCFNAGCDAHPRVVGGAVEWARAWENFQTRGETVAFLRGRYRSDGLAPSPRLLPVQAYKDFCRYPKEMRRFRPDPSTLQLSFERFAVQKWGLGLPDLMGAGAGWCMTGPYARRLIFPVVMNHVPVGFQARTIGAAAAKYLTSSHGKEEDPGAECGRPAEAMLYGLDDIPPGAEIVLVEGIPDTLSGRKSGLWTLGLLGTALTPEKLSLIVRARPKLVTVGLDAEPETAGASADMVANLLTWGVDAASGTWSGGKDAGSGAALVGREERLSTLVLRRLRPS